MSLHFNFQTKIIITIEYIKRLIHSQLTNFTGKIKLTSAIKINKWIFQIQSGVVPKWLRGRSAKPLFSGSIPLDAYDS